MKAVYCRKKTYQQSWQPKDRRELRNVAEGALVLQNLAKTTKALVGTVGLLSYIALYGIYIHNNAF